MPHSLGNAPSTNVCPTPPAFHGTTLRIGDNGVSVYAGHHPTFVPGQTYASPFGVYQCAPYIRAAYVVTTPYIYVHGRETGTFEPFAENNRYYQNDAFRGRALRAALNDLQAFWEENDARALRRRVLPDVAVAVFQNERYTYSLRRVDFLALTADALDRITTLSFRFDTVRDRTDGLVNAHAVHSYRVRGDSKIQLARARYTLVYVDGDWHISAVSLSPDVAGATP